MRPLTYIAALGNSAFLVALCVEVFTAGTYLPPRANGVDASATVLTLILWVLLNVIVTWDAHARGRQS